jgi:hypothetical protein
VTRYADALTGPPTRSIWYGDDARETPGTHYPRPGDFQKLRVVQEAVSDLPYRVGLGIGNGRREITVTLTKTLTLPVETSADALIAAIRGAV